MDNIIIDDNYSTFDETKKVRPGWYLATYDDTDSPLVGGRPAYYIEPTKSGKSIKVMDKVWLHPPSYTYMTDFNFDHSQKPKNYRVKQIKWEPNIPVNIITYPTGGYDFLGEPKLDNLAFANFFGRAINGSSRIKDHIELIHCDYNASLQSRDVLERNGYSKEFITN